MVFHITMTKTVPDTFDRMKPCYVVGLDRGLRFLAAGYDEAENYFFISGRVELQSKVTKSAKRALKSVSGRENRWMADVEGTLFVIEDLIGVSFNTERRSKKGRKELRNWTFYQLEQFLTYKAASSGSYVLKVPALQRCPKRGRIRKENQHHDIHEYICDACGYRSNDDRIGAMNLYNLGKMYVSGDMRARIRQPKK